MNKREFIKAGLLGAAGIISIPAIAGRSRLNFGVKEFPLPELNYSYSALEPYFDKRTIQILHTKYHAEYTSKLNYALVESGVRINTVRELLENISAYNSTLKINGGAYLNHKMFWKYLSPTGGGEPGGRVGAEISRQFGSTEAFRKEFKAAAQSDLGKGWAWLVSRNGKLKVTSTSNQDSPYMDTLPDGKRGFPVLCLNVWEHSYEFKYKYKEDNYFDAFWNIVNWEQVNKRFEKSLNII